MNHEGASAQAVPWLCHLAAEAQRVKQGQQMRGRKGPVLGRKGRRDGGEGKVCVGEGTGRTEVRVERQGGGPA